MRANKTRIYQEYFRCYLVLVLIVSCRKLEVWLPMKMIFYWTRVLTSQASHSNWQFMAKRPHIKLLLVGHNLYLITGEVIGIFIGGRGHQRARGYKRIIVNLFWFVVFWAQLLCAWLLKLFLFWTTVSITEVLLIFQWLSLFLHLYCPYDQV